MWSSLFVLMPIFISIVYAFILLTRKGCNRKLAYIMSSSLILGTGMYLIMGAYYLYNYELFYQLDIIYNYLALLLFPTAILYINILTRNTINPAKLFLIFIPPFILSTAIWIMYYSIGHSLATQFIQNAYYGKDIALPSHSALKWLYTIGFKYFNYIISIQILCFLFDSYIALKTYRSTLNNYYSDADCAKYKKHYITVIGIICWGITCLTYSIVSSFFPRSEYAFVNYLFIVHFIIIFVVGHSASRITHTMADIIARNDHIEQMMDVSKVSITDDEIYAKLIFHIEESKAYLVPQLSIYDLCTELNVNRIRLSYVIFEHFGLSFSAYINKLRVEYATEYLRQNPDIHIDSLYTLCGFTSIASFYRSFKSFKHCSPKQWAISGNDSISIA